MRSNRPTVLPGSPASKTCPRIVSGRDALMWNFTVLGEASTQVSDELKSRFKDVGWQQPSRLRNRVVHGYWTIDLEILHVTATDFLPGFIASLRTVLLAIETDDVSDA